MQGEGVGGLGLRLRIEGLGGLTSAWMPTRCVLRASTRLQRCSRLPQPTTFPQQTQTPVQDGIMGWREAQADAAREREGEHGGEKEMHLRAPGHQALPLLPGGLGVRRLPLLPEAPVAPRHPHRPLGQEGQARLPQAARAGLRVRVDPREFRG